MTGELIVSEKTVRILDSEIGPVIPAVDIAEMIGYSRSAINKALVGIEGTTGVCKVFKPLPTPGGIQPFLCLNRTGIDYLFLLIHPSKTRMSIDQLLDFRKHIVSKLEAGNAPTVPKQDPLLDSLNRNADIAEILISRYEYDAKVARSIAMANVVNEVGDAALPWKGPAALPVPDTIPTLPDEADPDFEKYFSLKKMCEMCRSTRDEVVNILEKERIISYTNGIWHLTGLGQQFGKTFRTYPLYPHRMMAKIHIRYSPAAINIIRGRLASKQTVLPAEA